MPMFFSSLELGRESLTFDATEGGKKKRVGRGPLILSSKRVSADASKTIHMASQT